MISAVCFLWQGSCVSMLYGESYCLTACRLASPCCFWIAASVRTTASKSCIFSPVSLRLFVCGPRICFFFQEEELERLEREFAIQSQITEAARRLASDPHVSSKKLKKQRKTSYLNALKKLQEIENSINEYRVRSGKKPTQRASLIIEGTDMLLLSLDSYLLWLPAHTAFLSV